jgi:hypothetical protein
MKKKRYIFKDLKFTPHPNGMGGVQAKMDFDNGHRISVVGGSEGLYGDGVNTFEIWRSCDSDVKGYLTPEEVSDEMISLQKLPNGSEHSEFGY